MKIYIRNIVLLSIAISFALLYSCKKDDEDNTPPVHETTPYNFVVPQGFPTNLNIPTDNPITMEGVELGRYLFYDGRLSGRDDADSLMSCATCHLQSAAFEIGPNHPKYTDGHPYGLTGIKTPHFPLPLFNLVWNNEGYLWNGFISKENTALGIPSYGIPAEPQYHLTNIESLVWMGIVAKHEIHGTIEMTERMIRSIDMYPPLFEKAFGDRQINIDRISKSIAQFIRTITSSDSKFDKYLRGEENLSPAENRGYVLFQTEEGADCFHCHGSLGNPLMTTNQFYNNAKDTVFDDPRDRYGVTKNPIDHGAYKATTLRNIELTGPYMHDGRFKTLDEVIDFYSEGLVYSEYAHPLMEKLRPPYGRGAELNPGQKADLKAFLLSLTDETLLTKEEYSNPF
ncbi:MAG: cytochrome-c peroxidase [Bacteroidetes bacterium 4572_112]|nr:MAG: cytochrome-c peroxidase [Bacteroidetes bacterium 4572_112]